jgi:hypothetical protein
MLALRRGSTWRGLIGSDVYLPKIFSGTLLFSSQMCSIQFVLGQQPR